jgi:hypothetical protein
VAGFTFAALMSIYSAAAQVSTIVGGHLYERVFHQQTAPLICVAAGFTLIAYLWVPFLPTGNVDQASDESPPSHQRQYTASKVAQLLASSPEGQMAKGT